MRNNSWIVKERSRANLNYRIGLWLCQQWDHLISWASRWKRGWTILQLWRICISGLGGRSIIWLNTTSSLLNDFRILLFAVIIKITYCRRSWGLPNTCLLYLWTHCIGNYTPSSHRDRHTLHRVGPSPNIVYRLSEARLSNWQRITIQGGNLGWNMFPFCRFTQCIGLKKCSNPKA